MKFYAKYILKGIEAIFLLVISALLYKISQLLKLNLFGLELNLFPIKYGNLGFLKFLKMPSDAGVESKVAKYAYVPFG